MKNLTIFWIFLTLSAFICNKIPVEGFEAQGSSYTIIEDKAKTPILTPSLSERKVLKIRLKNDLEAVLISDPKTDKSGAALSVSTGSWEDSQEYPGIAHFLEHMLFLGTKKYPQESAYQKYIEQHGGSTNAFTANNYTSYIFTVNNDAFAESLDRFSQFFIEPLFNPSGVARELNAIDQEFAKNVENDDVRVLQVVKELGNPQHPNHRFSIGNSQTLSSVSRETLKKWYAEHYSANLMRLFVFSSLPMDQLKDLVVQDFSGIVNSGRKRAEFNLPMASADLVGKMVYIQPVKDIHQITLVWDMPQKFSKMKDTRPDDLICQILGHEGEESLLAELKKENLAEKLSCGVGRLGPDNLSAYVQIDLTHEGVQKIDLVIERFFQIVQLLKQKGVPKYIFDEVQKMDVINYQYQKREDAFKMAMDAASNMMEEEMDSFPEKQKIIQKYEPADIQAFLEYMTPKNTQFYLDAPSSMTGVKPDKKEKWMGVEFAVRPIPEDTFKKWEKASSGSFGLDIPSKNTFIPQKLLLIQNVQHGEKDLRLVPHPKTLIDNEFGKIYFLSDDRYLVPEIYWQVNIKTPAIQIGKGCKVVLGDLYVKSLEEALNKLSYPATLAGLDYKIKLDDNGIIVYLQGYSESAHILFEEILKQMKGLEVSEERFNLYKQSLLRDYLNFEKEPPLKQAFDILKSAIYKDYTTKKQKARCIKRISYEKFTQFTKDVLNKTYVEALLYGNLTEQEARSLSGNLFATLGGSPYPVKEQLKPEVIILPANRGPYYLEEMTKASGNAVILAVEGDQFSLQKRGAQQVLMQAMSEPFFSTLRTKQQTGYIVYSTGEEWERGLFNIFAVQSNTHDVRDLLARFELFIEGYIQEMGKTASEVESFETIKKSLLTKLEQPQISLERMGDLLYLLAFDYNGDFDWISKRIDALNGLTYDEYLKISKEFMGRENKRRLAILMKGLISDGNIFSYQPIPNLFQLRKMSQYHGK